MESGYDSEERLPSSEVEAPEPTAAVPGGHPDFYPHLRSAGKPSAPDSFLNGPRPGTTTFGGGSMTVAYGHAAVQAGLEALEWDVNSPPGITTYLSADGVLAIAMIGQKHAGDVDANGTEASRAKLDAAAASFGFGKTFTGVSALHAALRNAAWEPYTETHLILTTSLPSGIETVVIMGHQHVPAPLLGSDSDNLDSVEVEVTFGRTIDVAAALHKLHRITQKAELKAKGVLMLSSSDGEASGDGDWQDEELLIIPQKKKRGRRRPRERVVKW